MLHFVIFIDAHPISSSRSFAVFFFTFSVNWGHQVDRESVASPLPRQVSFWGGIQPPKLVIGLCNTTFANGVDHV